MRVAQETVVKPASALRGALRVPGDKSISHRYALLAALADGESTIVNYATGADCASTLACLAALGITVTRRPESHPGGTTLRVRGQGLRGLSSPAGPLDCGNSGTTFRLLAGVVAAHSFASTLVGDASLSRRPMLRVITPLAQMGAGIEAAPGDRAPLTIRGGELAGISFSPDVPSAQVKGAVLLAGLQARGRTTITEPGPSRDHTERALGAFGAEVTIVDRQVAVEGGQRLTAKTLHVPGDISSAAFLLAAAVGLAGSCVTVHDVGLNPSRTHLLDMLRRWGARIDVDLRDERDGEPSGAVTACARPLGSLEITPDEVPNVIDELPVLAALATFVGELRVTGAGELRVKESDRITALVTGLRAMGAHAEELADGFHVRGGRRLAGGCVDARHDHRLAMAFAVAALGASAPTRIDGADAVAVSYPTFFEDLERLRA
ncbi:MAG: 3-phosphoshikimate 1-carboxyvinyltransferase [Vicinamibacterales bacterium]